MVTPSRSTAPKKKTNGPRFNTSHIPTDMKDAYDTRFAPLVMVFAGLGEPFMQPTLETVQQIFDLAYPDNNYAVLQDDVFFKMVNHVVHGPVHE